MAIELQDLLPLAGLVAALAVAGYIFLRMRLPPVVGYLLVGLFGNQLVANAGVPEDIVIRATEIGVLFLLFAIGLELDITRLRDALRRTAIVLPVGILVPGLLVAGVARLAGWSLLQAVTLGICLSVSSTLFGERLSSSPKFPPEGRRRVLGMLLAEDVLSGALLALVVVLGSPPGTADPLAPFLTVGRLLLYLLLAAAAALVVVPRVLDMVARRHSHELLVLTGIALVIGFGALGALAGAAPLGALVAGVAAAEAGSRFVVRNALQSIRELSLAAFFFASGLPVRVEELVAHPFLIAGLALLFVVAKLIVHVPTSLAAGLGMEASLRTALALGTVGEFSLILVATAGLPGLVGLVHPLLATAVVGSMVLLLVVTPILMRLVPTMMRLIGRLPARVVKPLQWLVQSSRPAKRRTTDTPRLRAAIRLLAVNLVLLATWALLAAAAGPWVLERLPASWHSLVAPILLVGGAIAVSVPLLLGTFRAYRTVVTLVAGGDGDRASQVRIRLVDAWVLSSIALLLVPLSLLASDILPILLGGLFLAIIIVTVAWRRLTHLHHSMEASMARVLGHDPQARALLDRILERYPWGIRLTAVAVPPTRPVVGMKLGDIRIQPLTGATVAVIQRRGREIVNPGTGESVYEGDTLVLLGDVHQIARAEALVVADGEALRLTAQSRMATIEEIEVHPGSALVGTTLSAADIRQRTGILVVGVWPKAAQHPMPYHSGHTLGVGDRLIVLGAPLQIERARLLAEGQEIESSLEAKGEAPA
jgi:monovalent cation:H+ antiporter-2, CPA2 family